ncbi:RNA-directed DNA polymerase, eukaryota, reverse transcriptase zinc-binding domain protein [Tanacetum coccineum]
MIEFQSTSTKENFLSHVGVGSWFSSLQQASDSFHADERVAWIDIEGVPLKAWTTNTFTKIITKWGDLLYEDDKEETCFHRKRVCIKTKMNGNIFESFKIIVKVYAPKDISEKKYGKFPRGGNSSFIALIPKSQNANLVKDYRPISLIESLYKIIAKILANRLVVVLGDIVSDVQSTFVADRQILDGPLILNDLIQCKAIHGKDGLLGKSVKSHFPSIWLDIIRDLDNLKNQGIDLLGLFEKKIDILRKIASWWDVNPPQVVSFEEWEVWMSSLDLSSNRTKREGSGRAKASCQAMARD